MTTTIEPRIISSRIEHREARPERPNPLPGLGSRLRPAPAVPAHEVQMVEVADYGRNRGTPHLTTLELPAEWTREQVEARIREGSAQDWTNYRAGD